jgi:hypothetical protein
VALQDLLNPGNSQALEQIIAHRDIARPQVEL